MVGSEERMWKSSLFGFKDVRMLGSEEAARVGIMSTLGGV